MASQWSRVANEGEVRKGKYREEGGEVWFSGGDGRTSVVDLTSAMIVVRNRIGRHSAPVATAPCKCYSLGWTQVTMY